MIVSIEAKGVFPVAIYALGGDFMRASKLHECGAVISLVEEMRQMDEICDVSKVATVLFAGRLKVARRILQPLVDSGLIVMDSSGCLSLCENEEVRQASLSLSELRFEPPSVATSSYSCRKTFRPPPSASSLGSGLSRTCQGAFRRIDSFRFLLRVPCMSVSCASHAESLDRSS